MNKTFIVGADSNCEWMLSWWYANFKKHNKENIPLTICDFGLSKVALDWCEKNKLNVKKVTGATGWFFKPTALRSVKAKQKVWIDVDCEIRGSISPLFDFIESDKLSCSFDRFHSWGCLYQTGVVGVQGDPKILIDWESRCKKPSGPYARGDQELLWDLVGKDYDKKISIIPEKYNRLRMSLDSEKVHHDTRIIHWTGEAGKKIIEHKMKKL